MSIQNEQVRSVVLGSASPEETVQQLRTEISGQPDIEDIGKAVIQFTPVPAYTTFTAEYALVGGENIVVHFFLTPEMQQGTGNAGDGYWLTRFPQVLDGVAREHFQANFPRLMAKYTEELQSWWFKAQGYGDRIDLDKFLTAFFEKLDVALERAGSS